MVNAARLTLATAVLLVGFASPLLADCLESGAAESCGGGGYGGGYYAQVSPNRGYGFGYARSAINRRFE